MRLHITLAGDITVTCRPHGGGRVLSGPARVVLAALVLERRTGLERDRLAGIVWPEAMPRTWASALRTHVSRVRTALSDALGATGEVLTSSGARYHLALPGGTDLVVDVEEAAAGLAAARAALPDDPGLALIEADRAAELVRAPFLAGQPGEWAAGARSRVEDVLVAALRVASEAATALGDTDRAVATAEEAARRAPLNEPTHRALMTALRAAGDRAGALRAYQRARRLLVDELGVDPSPETEAAYLALLGPSPAPPAPAADPSPAAPPAGPPRAPGTVPFVGRAPELALLDRAWHAARQGARHVVVISGETGIGKSRLASEAARRIAAAGGQVLFGRCDQEAIVPYQPIVEALDGVAATTPLDELRGLRPEAVAELAAILPGLGMVPRPPPPDRARLFAAVTDLVAALAAERPLLLVLDDLQWADDDTLLLLRHLLRRAGAAPVLVIAISRDHDIGPGGVLAEVVHALDRDGWVRRVALGGLGEADVRTLLAHLVGTGDHRGLARRVVAETAGNPFLVTALGRAAGAGEGDGAIPPSVQDLVTTRLGRLDGRVVKLLQSAAVGGARFDLDVAGSAAGLSAEEALDGLEAALDSGLVIEETPDRYRFAHDIVRRTLVARLGGARRRVLHQRTADAVERLRRHDLDSHTAVLAHHAAAGADPGGDERAVQWSRRASEQAISRGAPAEAVRLCRQALAHVPPGNGALLAEVTTELGIAQLAAGDAGAAGTLADGAALAHRHGRPDALGRAGLALADAAGAQPALRDVAREVVDVALAAGAPPPGRGPELLSRDTATGGERPGAPGGDAAVLRARLVAHRRRLGPVAGAAGGIGDDAPRLVAALARRTADLGGPTRLVERRRLADELAELATAAGDARAALVAAHHRAMAAAEAGDETTRDDALCPIERAAGADPWARAVWAERAVARCTAEGRLDDARAALAGAVAAAAAARAAVGPDDLAFPLVDAPGAVEARHRVVLDWLAGKDPVPSLLGTPPPDDAGQLQALAVEALAAVAHGQDHAVAAARAALAPFADRTCGVGYRSFAGAASFHLGRLAAVSGDWSDAERHLQAALRRHTLLRARPWVALTQRALAGVLEARGRTSDLDWVAGLRAEADHVTSRLGLRGD